MDIEDEYDAWHQRRADDEGPGEAPQDPWHVTVARLLPDLNGKRVLEIGCGRGDFSIWLNRTYPGANVTGVDFSEVAIATARRRAKAAKSPATFGVENAEALSFADGSFDYVVSCECMEHVPHPQKMADEIARVLRPGGGFILTTENYFNGMILTWLRTWLTGKPYDSGSGQQPHENFFVFWAVRGMLQKGGLKVSHLESNHYQWLLLPRVDPAKLMTETFESAGLRRLFRPFGRHFTFMGERP